MDLFTQWGQKSYIATEITVNFYNIFCFGELTKVSHKADFTT